MRDRSRTSDLARLVPHLAGLAHLALTRAEAERFGEEFRSIVEFVEQVASVEVELPPGTTTISGVQHVQRDDAREPSLLAEALLAQAPDARDRFVRSPAVL